jgi:multidrug resistance efflux pump
VPGSSFRAVLDRVACRTAPADFVVGPGSILDASGYVVARRQATVSSKIAGKVVDVRDRGRAARWRDEIIARLDDTNARATVAGARKAQSRRTSRRALCIRERNACPFQRNEQQFARAIISAQTFDTAKATSRGADELGSRSPGRGVADASLSLAERTSMAPSCAPFAGIVTVKAAQEGEMVSPISAGGGFRARNRRS